MPWASVLEQLSVYRYVEEMKKLYDHMIRQWQEKEMKSAVAGALLSGLENSYVHNESRNNLPGTLWWCAEHVIDVLADDTVVPLKTWASNNAPQLRVLNSFIGATTKSFKSTPYVPLFKRPTEGTSVINPSIAADCFCSASLEERLENAGDKKKQKIDQKNQNNPRVQKQRQEQKNSNIKDKWCPT